ncbi:MAG: GrpB family protein [Nitriliruptorales bacterium]|nr:GrpB family protein [Nitriliruptorales bacterium]
MPKQPAPADGRTSARRIVEVVDHDPTWVARFEELRDRLLAAVADAGAADQVVAVEHVGSTSVPGLPAKPIIDVLVGLSSWPAPAFVRALVARADLYDHGELGWPGRHYLTNAPAGAPRTVHVHAVVHGSWFWTEQLRFRDHLRSHPEDAEAYRVLKEDLASRHHDEPAVYTAAKTDFVRDVLRRARALAGERDVATLPAEDPSGSRVGSGVPPLLAERLALQPGQRVVVLGGGGQLARNLAEAGMDVTAVASPDGALESMTAPSSGSVEVVSGTAEEIDVPWQSVDAGVIGPGLVCRDRWAALAELHRVVRDDGRVTLVEDVAIPGEPAPAWLEVVRPTTSFLLRDVMQVGGTSVCVLERLSTDREGRSR